MPLGNDEITLGGSTGVGGIEDQTFVFSKLLILCLCADSMCK